MTSARCLRRPLRGAIVGYGFIGERGHVPAYALARADAASRSSPWPTSARRAGRRRARRFPGARIYESHEQLLAGRAAGASTSSTSPRRRATTRAIARDALSTAGSTSSARSRWRRPARTRARWSTHAREVRRVIFPCHNYKHAPVIKAVRQILDAGLIGQVQLVTLQTFRNTHAKGVDEWRPRLAAREPLLRRRHRHGPREPHLLPGVRLARRVSRRPSAPRCRTLGDFDTEDNFSCAITFPNGTASAHLSWTAGMRKVIYTHPRRARRDPRRGRRRRSGRHERRRRRGPDHVGDEEAEDRVRLDGREPRRLVSLALRRSSRPRSRGTTSSARRRRRALRCVELITTAYASARDRSRRARRSLQGRARDRSRLRARARDGHAGHRRGVRRPGLARRGGAGVAHRASRRLAAAREGSDGDGLLGASVRWPAPASRSGSRRTRSRGLARPRGRRRASRSALGALRRRRRRQPRVVGVRRARRHGRARDGHGERRGRGPRRGGRPLRGALLLRRRRASTSASTASRSSSRSRPPPARSWSATRRRRPRRSASTAPRGAMRRQERAVYLVVGVALVPIAAAVCARAGLPPWVARVPLFAVLALVAIVGNVSAVRRLRAIARGGAQARGTARAKTSNGAERHREGSSCRRRRRPSAEAPATATRPRGARSAATRSARPPRPSSTSATMIFLVEILGHRARGRAPPSARRSAGSPTSPSAARGSFARQSGHVAGQALRYASVSAAGAALNAVRRAPRSRPRARAVRRRARARGHRGQPPLELPDAARVRLPGGAGAMKSESASASAVRAIRRST